MDKLRSELVWLKIQLNSHYGTERISTSGTIKRLSEIKKIIKRVEKRKSRIINLLIK